MRLARPILRYETVMYALAAYVAFVLNGVFWRHLFAVAYPANVYDWLFLAAVAAILWLVTLLMIGATAVGRLFKPLTMLLLVTCAAAGHLMREYGIIIDAGMIVNAQQTDRAEAADLITVRLLASVVLWGVLPGLLLCWVQIRKRPRASEVKRRVMATLVITVAITAIAYPFFINLASVFREHAILKHELLPFNIFASMSRVGLADMRAKSPKTRIEFGGDAVKGPSWARRDAKSVTVVVIGETARAQNFSLNGYPRVTNPRLAKVDGLVSFKDVTACGTATAQSLPCLFSGVGQAKSRASIGVDQEGLLDILQRAGIALLWRDNQGGCKGVCTRIPTVMLQKPTSMFDSGSGTDERLLDGVQAWIDGIEGHGVLVLHMIGSHGPAYFKRYPAAFEVFEPACKDTQFSHCTRDTLVNAYDNTIHYTDHVLGELIDLLRANDAKGIATAMTYVSDHGESLGEGGIYLHGLPYALAPVEQKKVPWLWWLSPSYEAAAGISTACLASQADRALTHDHFFHSVLGLLDVRTRVHDSSLDITRPCLKQIGAE